MLDEAARAENRRSLDDLAAEICTMAGHINAANYRWLTLIAEFDRRQGWADNVTQSCAHWLNWKCGIGMGAAREKVRVARALETLPKVAAAMECGKLSYSKAREITRVACSNTEEYLVQIAEHGTAQHVERIVRAFRRCKEAEELSRETRQQQNRFLAYRYDDDGSLILNAQLPAEIGALVLKALGAAVEELPKTDVPAGRSEEPPTLRMRRADAMGLMAETFLKSGAMEANGGDRHQLVVHVDAETLQHRTAGCCEIEDGPSIPAETARRLACDASVVAIVEDEEGDPLNVGRKTRTISTPLRRLLNARDRGCRFPGCANNRYVDAHHVQHWADGGETKPSNLVSLCRFHHHAVHEGGIEVQGLDDGALRFVKLDGTSVDSIAPGFTQPLGDWRDLRAENERHSIRIDARTAVTRWDGVRFDYSLGVEVLMQHAKRGKRIPAGTSNLADGA